MKCGDLGSQPKKVIWSEGEKARIVRRAAEIQESRPDLSGLRLLREAMMVLPVDRRRKVAAVTLTPWFEVGIQSEARRRADERATALPQAQMDLLRNQILEENMRTLTEWRIEHQHWRAQSTAMHDQLIALVTQLLIEVRALNATARGQVYNPSQERRRQG